MKVIEFKFTNGKRIWVWVERISVMTETDKGQAVIRIGVKDYFLTETPEEVIAAIDEARP